MKKELIEKYIQTAYKNGFNKFVDIKEGEIKIEFERVVGFKFINIIQRGAKIGGMPLIELITSKEFIEAIAKYRIKMLHEGEDEERMDLYFEHFTSCIMQITYEQAITIRDGKLEEFMENVLSNN